MFLASYTRESARADAMEQRVTHHTLRSQGQDIEELERRAAERARGGQHDR